LGVNSFDTFVAANFLLTDQHRFEVGARGVNGGGVTGRAPALRAVADLGAVTTQRA